MLAVLFAAAAVGYALRSPEPAASLPVIVRSAWVERGLGELIEPAAHPEIRSLDSYRGYGTWVDVFDYSAPYAGAYPPVTPATLDLMAQAGVRTIYLQAARLDDRTPNGLIDRGLLADMLIGAHQRGMAVVAWYLPKWVTDGRDLERIGLIDDFEVLGHRFDGIAIDIEWTFDGLDPIERSRRLVTLSAASRVVSDGPIGAIVVPPVLTDVINLDYWPDFPWREIGPLYDVWLPMSYWSFRSDSSGYGDGYAYHEESVRRLRDNLGDPSAAVHGIGGIGGVDGIGDEKSPAEPLATLDEMEGFVRALVASGSIGGSIYDWNTMEPAVRVALAGYFATGIAANL